MSLYKPCRFSLLGDWWDILKIQICRTCIDFSSQKHKQLLSERNSLTKRLLRAKSAVFAGNRDQISNVNKLESALEAVIDNECEGAKIRSQAQWIDEFVSFFPLSVNALRKMFLNLFSMSLARRNVAYNDIELIFYKVLFSKDPINTCLEIFVPLLAKFSVPVSPVVFFEILRGHIASLPRAKIGQALSPCERELVLINIVLTSAIKAVKKELFIGTLHALSSNILRLALCRRTESFLRGS